MFTSIVFSFIKVSVSVHMPHINRESPIHKRWLFRKREPFPIKYIFCIELHRIKERKRNTVLFAMHKNCSVFSAYVVDYCILEDRRPLVLNHHWWNNVKAEICLKKIASNTSLAKFLIIHFLCLWSVSYLIIL